VPSHCELRQLNERVTRIDGGKGAHVGQGVRQIWGEDMIDSECAKDATGPAISNRYEVGFTQRGLKHYPSHALRLRDAGEANRIEDECRTRVAM